jgi:hypothetical protein
MPNIVLLLILETPTPVAAISCNIEQELLFESSLDVPYGGKHSLSLVGKALTGASARASPSMPCECLPPYGTSKLDSTIVVWKGRSRNLQYFLIVQSFKDTCILKTRAELSALRSAQSVRISTP